MAATHSAPVAHPRGVEELEDIVSQLTVEVVAADRVVWEGEARQVSARTLEGEIGVLPGHEALLAVLAEGDVSVIGVNGDNRTVRVDGGFMSVDHDNVRIVSEAVTEATSA